MGGREKQGVSVWGRIRAEERKNRRKRKYTAVSRSFAEKDGKRNPRAGRACRAPMGMLAIIRRLWKGLVGSGRRHLGRRLRPLGNRCLLRWGIRCGISWFAHC